MLNSALLPRPWSCDVPRVAGYEPLIGCKVERINNRRKRSWRAEILVDDCGMAMSHHDTKDEAERWCARMLNAYAESHYHQK